MDNCLPEFGWGDLADLGNENWLESLHDLQVRIQEGRKKLGKRCLSQMALQKSMGNLVD